VGDLTTPTSISGASRESCVNEKRKTYFGYKSHLAVDKESGIVRRAEVTSADLHDSQLGLAMIQGDEQAYYGDKAYDSQALRNELKDKGIGSPIGKMIQQTASRVRVGVERANTTMKNWYGMAKIPWGGWIATSALAECGCEHQLWSWPCKLRQANSKRRPLSKLILEQFSARWN